MIIELFCYVGFIVFTFLCGACVGATFVRDWLDGVGTRRSAKLPPAIYKAGVVVDLGEWRRLELPTVRRKGVN